MNINIQSTAVDTTVPNMPFALMNTSKNESFSGYQQLIPNTMEKMGDYENLNKMGNVKQGVGASQERSP